MNPHIKILTLGVDDLERSVAYYRDGLGFDTKGIIGTEFARQFEATPCAGHRPAEEVAPLRRLVA